MSYQKLSMQVLALLLITAIAVAEVPQLITYQGRLTETDGSAVPDGSYNLTFQIVEHDPPPMGEDPLWSSGVQSVQVTDGVFVYYLGSNTPLPVSIFEDDALESYFVRVLVEGSMVASQGVQMVAVPFALRSASADTAEYAHVSPGGGGEGGWVDDGSVVRLQNSSDKVGIGTSTPTDKLVVGGNLGTSIDDSYIVTRNDHQTYSGYRLGYNSDNFGWMRWNGLGEEIRFGTRTVGVNYLETMVLRRGNVGIGQLMPGERLVVGDDLGSYSGNRIVVGDHSPADYTGFMMGEDADNRAFITWNIDNNFLGIGIEDEGTQWNNMIRLEYGNVYLGVGSGNASVQLPDDAVSSPEILNESGLANISRSLAIWPDSDVWTTVCEEICQFPSSGYALVIATCECSATNNDRGVIFALSRNDVPSSQSYTEDWHNAEFTGSIATITTTVHEVFAVSAGENAFQLLVLEVGTMGEIATHHASLSVLFVPSTYAAKGGDGATAVSDHISQPILYSPESKPPTLQTHSVTASDLDQLRQENAELRRRLEAIEAMLENQ